MQRCDGDSASVVGLGHEGTAVHLLARALDADQIITCTQGRYTVKPGNSKPLNSTRPVNSNNHCHLGQDPSDITWNHLVLHVI
jgi:hypothetical protein